MKVTFFCMGSGEAAQAVALAKALTRGGHHCSFVVTNEVGKNYVKEAGFTDLRAYLKWPKRVAGGIDQGYRADKIGKIINEMKPEVLVVCNSKATSWGFLTSRPKAPELVIALDSNWLFNQYPDVQITDWIEKIIIGFPETVFAAGFKENGGYYQIKSGIKNKIYPVGFIPSIVGISQAKRDLIKKEYCTNQEKLIFCYVGWGNYFSEIFPRVVEVIDQLGPQAKKLKMVYTGEKDFKLPWGIYEHEKLLDPGYFQTVLSASDLIIAHQGITTLMQAIGANIPIIMNVPAEGKYHSGRFHTSYYEARIFANLGLCWPVRRDEPIKKLSQAIENLLFNQDQVSQMKTAQKKYYSPGEERAARLIEKWSRA